jgi:hypothetical protein
MPRPACMHAHTERHRQTGTHTQAKATCLGEEHGVDLCVFVCVGGGEERREGWSVPWVVLRRFMEEGARQRQKQKQKSTHKRTNARTHVGEDAAARDGGLGEELVELLVVADGELQVARDDADLLLVCVGMGVWYWGGDRRVSQSVCQSVT